MLQSCELNTPSTVLSKPAKKLSRESLRSAEWDPFSVAIPFNNFYCCSYFFREVIYLFSYGIWMYVWMYACVCVCVSGICRGHLVRKEWTRSRHSCSNNSFSGSSRVSWGNVSKRICTRATSLWQRSFFNGDQLSGNHRIFRNRILQSNLATLSIYCLQRAGLSSCCVFLWLLP